MGEAINNKIFDGYFDVMYARSWQSQSMDGWKKREGKGEGRRRREEKDPCALSICEIRATSSQERYSILTA